MKRNKANISIPKIDWINIGLLIAYLSFFILVIILFAIIKADGTKCIAAPFNYGANELAKREGADVLGTITIFNNRSDILAFSNNKNISESYINNISKSSIKFMPDWNITLIK